MSASVHVLPGAWNTGNAGNSGNSQVNGYELAKDIERFVGSKVWFGDGNHGRRQLVAYVLFVLGTYVFQYGQRAPRLIVNSARKRSGKTLLIIDITKPLVKNPRVYGGTTARAMLNDMRTFALGDNKDEVPVGCDRPTIIIDETDSIFAPNRDQEELRNVLCNGWRRGMCVSKADAGFDVSRNINMEPFAPVVLAGINNGYMPDTVIDRGINIALHRATPAEGLTRYNYRQDEPTLASFGERIAAWMDEDGRAERLGDTVVPAMDGLNDRALEVWEPLFAIADELGGEYPELARNAALGITVEESDDDSPETRLLTDLRTVFHNKANPWFMATAQIIADLIELDSSWGNFEGRNRSIVGQDIASVLRKYDAKPEKQRPEAKMPPVSGYKLIDLTKVWGRYLDVETAAA